MLLGCLKCTNENPPRSKVEVILKNKTRDQMIDLLLARDFPRNVLQLHFVVQYYTNLKTTNNNINSFKIKITIIAND